MDLPTEAEPVKVIEGDCLSVLRDLPDGCIDAVVSDPPYGLEFMGKEWDAPWKHGFAEFGMKDAKGRRAGPLHGSTRNPVCRTCRKHQRGTDRCFCQNPDYDESAADHTRAFGEWCHGWAKTAVRTLRPGGYAAVFGGSRTYHRLACAVEDAGFEVRDCLMWVYGTGFPKGKGCLKPAYEPILLCRRPGPKVLPLGIDECRVPTGDDTGRTRTTALGRMNDDSWRPRPQESESHPAGRWPANVLHDGSDEVMEAFAAFGPTSTTGKRTERSRNAEVAGTTWGTSNHKSTEYANEPPGTAARFFYCAKASKADRDDGNTHPTVKPVALMRWLVRLVCPAGGLVLDPFGGSGTTGVAALAEARRCLLVERMPEYVAIARRRTARPVNDLFATA